MSDLPYRVTVHQDTGCEDPLSNDGFYFDLFQFNNAYIHYKDEIQALACQWEPADPEEEVEVSDGEWDSWNSYLGYGQCEELPDDNIHLNSNAPFYHEWVPEYEIATFIRMSGDDSYYAVDKSDRAAGILVVKPRESKEWNTLTNEQKDAAITACLGEYSAWAGGNCWMVLLEKRTIPEHCPFCNSRTNDKWEFLDSLGGIIDGEGKYTKEIIQEMFQSHTDIRNPQEDVDYDLKTVYA